jgi:3-hydroxyacyl-CoA dehydrogenase/enoyl-CoA hydratase/3-hydroxybutyryl-CoA epimerase
MMGGGIALNAAQRGIEVVLIDRDQASAERGKAYAEKALAKQVERGRMAADQRDAILARITPGTDYEAAARRRHGGRGRVRGPCRQGRGDEAGSTPCCPSTACSPPTPRRCRSRCSRRRAQRPERFIGLHFFSPADRMPLVEVIRGKATSDATLAQALDFVAQLKKTPIVVNDARGFFTSRFIGAFVDDAIGMVAEGMNPALIDNCARQAGMPVGPLAITDELSIELSVHAGEAQKKEFPDVYKEGRAVPVLKKLYDLGRLGKKVGKGFYDHDESGKRLWPGLAGLYPQKAEQPNPHDLKQRILYVQARRGGAGDGGGRAAVTGRRRHRRHPRRGLSGLYGRPVLLHRRCRPARFRGRGRPAGRPVRRASAPAGPAARDGLAGADLLRPHGSLGAA